MPRCAAERRRPALGSLVHLPVSVAYMAQHGRHQATTLTLLSTKLGRGVQGELLGTVQASCSVPGKSTWTPSLGRPCLWGSQFREVKPEALLHLRPLPASHQTSSVLPSSPPRGREFTRPSLSCPRASPCGHRPLPPCSLSEWPGWPSLSSLHVAAGMIFPVQESGLSPAKTVIAFPITKLPPEPLFPKLSPDPCLPPCPPHTLATGTCHVPSGLQWCMPPLPLKHAPISAWLIPTCPSGLGYPLFQEAFPDASRLIDPAGPPIALQSALSRSCVCSHSSPGP